MCFTVIAAIAASLPRHSPRKSKKLEEGCVKALCITCAKLVFVVVDSFFFSFISILINACTSQVQVPGKFACAMQLGLAVLGNGFLIFSQMAWPLLRDPYFVFVWCSSACCCEGTKLNKMFKEGEGKVLVWFLSL